MTMEHSPYRLAEELELYLGDPADPHGPFSYAASADLDAREEFPAEICRLLDDWGLPDYYVPLGAGGRLRDYEHALQLVRTVARRDLTVAVAHGKTYLGAVCVWIAGSPEQTARLGADIRAGVPVALGLTERAHGSDLLAGEVEAVPEGSGAWRVTGEKWLINNATRGSVLALLARTAPDGGPRGFSVLLTDKRALAPGSYRHLPKVPTHGIRGADISGIALDRARVPRSTVVGAEGGGVETVLKALQLTRTMCASLSLGAADHGLRLALDFAAERELYGRRLAQLPLARDVLAAAAADALTHEAVALVASRLVHTATEELSVVSAVTKYLVPTGTEELLRELAAVLGARAFLSGVTSPGVERYGMFEKIERDHRIVALFDGNTLVNLNSLINQFRSLVRRWRRSETGVTEAAASACDLSAPLPAFDATRLTLLSRYGSSLLAALPAWTTELREEAERDPALTPTAQAAQRLLAVTESVHQEMAEPLDLVAGVPHEAFETARRYCLCFAGAACLGLWLHNPRAATTGVWRDADWLRTALDRLLVRLGDRQPGSDPEAYDRLLDEAYAARSAGRLFSLLHLGLAKEPV